MVVNHELQRQYNSAGGKNKKRSGDYPVFYVLFISITDKIGKEELKSFTNCSAGFVFILLHPHVLQCTIFYFFFSIFHFLNNRHD
jgi:hypothetical protein